MEKNKGKWKNPGRTWLLVFLLFLTGCGSSELLGGGARQAVIPRADGKKTFEVENLTADISNLDQGYLMVRYTGEASKLFVQLIGPDQAEYKYFLEPSQEYVTIPLTCGDGEYYLCAYENVGGEQYSPVLSQILELELENEFGPYLCSNQYVDFTMESQAVLFGMELTEGLTDGLEKVQKIYRWVTENIVYDYDEAVNVSTGYLPDIDETLRTKKGICFDYAALMTAMLRSQGIPSKLNIGYLTGDIYHAWISVYLEETGWIDRVIEFNGTDWQMMDPTVAASSGSREVEETAKDSANYIVCYVR